MKNINIAKMVAPEQPYGYYKPLMGLEQNSLKASKDRPVERAVSDVQTCGLSGLKSDIKNSRCGMTSALVLATAVVSVLNLGIIFAAIHAKSSTGNAGDNGFCGLDEAPLGNHSFVNQTLVGGSIGSANPSPVFGVLPPKAQEAATGVAAFSELAIDALSSTFGAGVAFFKDVMAAAVAKYYAIPEKLEEVTISGADQKILDIRASFPSYFKSSFVRRVLGNESATGKAITLGAAQGETSIPISQLYSLNRRCAGKCSLNTIQDIRGNPKGNPSSKEDFVQRQEMFGGYTEGGYEEYLEEFKASQASVDQVIGRVDPKIFAELEAAHNAQVASAPDLVNSRFMHFPENPVDGNFSEVGNYLGDAGWTQGSITRNEYGDSSIAHETRAIYSVNEGFDRDAKSIVVSRDVWSTHSKGKAESVWDKFRIGCSAHSDDVIECETLPGGIDHAYGEMRVALREKMVTPMCSLISETVTSGLVKKMYTYAINPTKKLPILFSQMVDSMRFAEAKKASFWSAMTGNTDAVVAFSTEMPDDLPKNCQELHDLEHPKPGIAQA